MTMEEALKCNRITAVLGEIKEISFKESRRLQLAAEQSRVTGFLFAINLKFKYYCLCFTLAHYFIAK